MGQITKEKIESLGDYKAQATQLLPPTKEVTDLQSFAERTLPAGCRYALQLIDHRGAAHQVRFADSFEEFAAEAERLKRKADANQLELFYSTAGLNPNATTRSRAQVHSKKDFPVDLDVGPGKGYATKTDAKAGVEKFCQTYDFPHPSLVLDSGGGHHAHWVCRDAVARDEWETTAAKFKEVLAHYNVHQDEKVTADAPRILRPPYTNNWKLSTARPVHAVHDKPELDLPYLIFKRHVERLYETVPTKVKVTKGTTSPSDLVDLAGPAKLEDESIPQGTFKLPGGDFDELIGDPTQWTNEYWYWLDDKDRETLLLEWIDSYDGRVWNDQSNGGEFYTSSTGKQTLMWEVVGAALTKLKPWFSRPLKRFRALSARGTGNPHSGVHGYKLFDYTHLRIIARKCGWKPSDWLQDRLNQHTGNQLSRILAAAPAQPLSGPAKTIRELLEYDDTFARAIVARMAGGKTYTTAQLILDRIQTAQIGKETLVVVTNSKTAIRKLVEEVKKAARSRRISKTNLDLILEAIGIWTRTTKSEDTTDDEPNIPDLTALPVVITHHHYMQRRGDSSYWFPLWRKVHQIRTGKLHAIKDRGTIPNYAEKNNLYVPGTHGRFVIKPKGNWEYAARDPSQITAPTTDTGTLKTKTATYTLTANLKPATVKTPAIPDFALDLVIDEADRLLESMHHVIPLAARYVHRNGTYSETYVAKKYATCPANADKGRGSCANCFIGRNTILMGEAYHSAVIDHVASVNRTSNSGVGTPTTLDHTEKAAKPLPGVMVTPSNYSSKFKTRAQRDKFTFESYSSGIIRPEKAPSTELHGHFFIDMPAETRPPDLLKFFHPMDRGTPKSRYYLDTELEDLAYTALNPRLYFVLPVLHTEDGPVPVTPKEIRQGWRWTDKTRTTQQTINKDNVIFPKSACEIAHLVFIDGGLLEAFKQYARSVRLLTATLTDHQREVLNAL